MPPSSRGLGHFPFTEVTGIRIPLGGSFYRPLDTLRNRSLDWIMHNQTNSHNTGLPPVIENTPNMTRRPTFRHSQRLHPSRSTNPRLPGPARLRSDRACKTCGYCFFFHGFFGFDRVFLRHACRVYHKRITKKK